MFGNIKAARGTNWREKISNEAFLSVQKKSILSRFADESFDLIFHPCSNCFMAELQPMTKRGC